MNRWRIISLAAALILGLVLLAIAAWPFLADFHDAVRIFRDLPRERDIPGAPLTAYLLLGFAACPPLLGAWIVGHVAAELVRRRRKPVATGGRT